MKTTLRQGFTLVELAIVLVIIGLIVGGVLVGQDLIKAAEINATVSQIEKYNAAVNTFRGKYNALPGDINNPAQFGLLATGGPGDGDGQLEAGACTNAFGLGGEAAVFWVHLSTTSLIADGISGTTTYAVPGSAVTISDTILPAARLGLGNRVSTFSNNGRNFFAVANMSSAAATSCLITSSNALSPLQAFQIDTKVDDGNAVNGTVGSIAAVSTAGTIGGGATGATLGTSGCYATDTATAPYTTIGMYATGTDTIASALRCQLRIRSSF